MSVSFIIKFNVKTDKKVSFNNIMNDVKSELPKTKGCIGVVIYQGVENKESYTLVETWESKKLHEDHVEGLISSGVWETIAGHLVEDPTGEYFDIL